MVEEMKKDTIAKAKPLTREEKIKTKKRIRELEETNKAFKHDYGILTHKDYFAVQIIHMKNKWKSDVAKIKMQIDGLDIHINAQKKKLAGK